MENFIFGLVVTACMVAVASSERDSVAIDEHMTRSRPMKLFTSHGWKKVKDALVWVNEDVWTIYNDRQPSMINDANCGQVSTMSPVNRIAGGEVTRVGQYPWNVHLSGSTYCGGSLINDWYVLTAADCLMTDIEMIIIWIGDQTIFTTTDGDHEIRKVRAAIIHERYRSHRSQDYDIGLVRLNWPVKFSDRIGTVCLPTEPQNYVGEEAVVTGWGMVPELDGLSADLREVSVTVFSNRKCKKYGYGAFTKRMLCAGNKRGGKCALYGDDGGPLVIKSRNKWTEIGIVSWRDLKGCGPGRYTRVTKFLDWIKRQSQSQY